MKILIKATHLSTYYIIFGSLLLVAAIMSAQATDVYEPLTIFLMVLATLHLFLGINLIFKIKKFNKMVKEMKDKKDRRKK